MKGLFVIGTGTEVGKTVVTAGLLRALRKRGLDVVSMKPVQTGGEMVGGILTAPDLAIHLAAAELNPPEDELALMSPYVFEPACSPHLAGRMAGHAVSIDHCQACAEDLAARHDGLLVEGAGGLLVPLNEDETQLALVIQIGLPVLLVAPVGLGTINHCLLTLETLHEAEVPVAGVVFNETTPGEGDSFIARDNPAAVAHFGKVAVLGNVPWIARGDGGIDWERFEGAIGGWDEIVAQF